MTEQIQNHQGTWVRAEDRQAMQARIDELSAEVERLKGELAKTPIPSPVQAA